MNGKPIRTAASIAIGTVALVALAAPNDCFFLQSSGCGSGESFCAEGSEVCDEGYSKQVDTGCGKKGPMVGGVTRRCYTLTDATTGDCDEPNPDGLETVGCTNGSGLCCYATKVWSRDLTSSMQIPAGEACCDKTVAQP